MGYKVSQISLWDTQIRPYSAKRYTPNTNTVIYVPMGWRFVRPLT